MESGRYWNLRERLLPIHCKGIPRAMKLRLYAHSMLAVMTYDVGFFFSITGSVLAGEFLLGRYSRSSHG
jgi:hypothetical protein